MFKKNANYQDIVKSIAIIAMVIDHLGLFLFPTCLEMRIIGRIAMPIFCFCAGYNFRNKIRIEVILGAIFVAIMNKLLNSPYDPNILISISLGLLYLKYIYPNISHNILYIHIFILTLLFPITKFMFDYGTLGIIIMIIAHMIVNRRINFKLGIMISLIIALSNILIYWPLTLNYNIIIIIMFCFLYKLMIFKNFTHNVNCKFMLLSRYSLYIYIVDLFLMEIIYLL
jgi:hypothetical protein